MLAAAESGSAIAEDYRDEEIAFSLAKDYKAGFSHCKRLIQCEKRGARIAAEPKRGLWVRDAGTLPRATPRTRGRATRSGGAAGPWANPTGRIDLARLQGDASVGSRVIY
jgi:hypothetical protein